MQFPTSGVDTSPLIPFAVAFAVSAVTSTGGVSGAFVLLPFQVSVLGFSTPAVTPTNHLFNVVAIPAGVYRYVREKRMLWPLALVIVIGTVPGVVVGSLLRIYLLPDPSHFKLFMGLVLAYIASRLLKKVLGSTPANASKAKGPLEVKTTEFSARVLRYTFEGRSFEVPVPQLAALTLIIGVVGGAYGVGGGAILAPFLVTLWRLPVHTIAGATLLGTCLTSVVGVAFFTVAGPLLGADRVAPDWWLGSLLGAGGVCGMYTGARLQRFVPARAIESILAIVVLAIAAKYVVGWFL